MANDNWKVDFEETLKSWGEKMVARIRQNMAEQGVNATGETSDSLEYTLTDYGIQILGAPYFAEKVEVGRTPTKNASPWDWRTQLSAWVKAKGLESQFGIGDDRDLDKVVRAIYWKITREGSQKYREPDKRTDVYSTALQEGVDELAEELIIKSGERIMGVLDEFAREAGDKVGTTKAK